MDHMNVHDRLASPPGRFQARLPSSKFVGAIANAAGAPGWCTLAQAVADFVRANRNCLAGAWPQLQVLLTAFYLGTASTATYSPGQHQDIGCLVELVEALPYTPHAALLVLQVATDARHASFSQSKLLSKPKLKTRSKQKLQSVQLLRLRCYVYCTQLGKYLTTQLVAHETDFTLCANSVTALIHAVPAALLQVAGTAQDGQAARMPSSVWLSCTLWA